MIRWLLPLLMTGVLGVAPSEGTRPAVMATYESGQGAERAGVTIWADDRGRVRTGTERIAGVTGDVYRVTLIEGETRAPPFEIVVAAAPRLAPVGREVLRFYDSLRAPILAAVGSVPQPYLAIREVLARGTPLRFGAMRLQSIEDRPLTDEMAARAGPVLSREAFTALMAGQLGPEDDVIYDVAEEGPPPPEGPAYINGVEIVDVNGSFEAVESANDAFPE